MANLLFKKENVPTEMKRLNILVEKNHRDYLSDSILDNLFPGLLRGSGRRSLNWSKARFMSRILVLSRSQADFL